MRALLGAWRLLRVGLHLLHGLGIVLLRFEHWDASRRHALVQWWSAALLRHLGLRTEVSGSLPQEAVLLVANHISWLDIAVIHSVCPQARFVSKADVSHWPLVGRLVRGAGTLFIQRERKRDAMRVVHEMAAALRAGDTLAVFPEGTTGEGPQVQPFHANLLQAAIAVEAQLQPVALRYSQPGQRFSEAAQYLGETSLLTSMWRIACAPELSMQVQFLPPQPSTQLERRALAEQLRGQIQAALDGGNRRLTQTELGAAESPAVTPPTASAKP